MANYHSLPFSKKNHSLPKLCKIVIDKDFG
jgi:hypothetical protein